MRPTTLLGTTPVMPVGRLDLDLIPHIGLLGAIALHVHCELDAHAGSGRFSMVTASLDEDRNLQLCRSGDQTWRLWRTDAGA